LTYKIVYGIIWTDFDKTSNFQTTQFFVMETKHLTNFEMGLILAGVVMVVFFICWIAYKVSRKNEKENREPVSGSFKRHRPPYL